MKGFPLLAVAFLLVAGCSKGGDAPTTVTDTSTKTDSSATGGKPVAQTNVATPAGVGTAHVSSTSAPPSAPGTYTFQFSPELGTESFKNSRKVDAGDGKPQESSNVMKTTTVKNPDGTFTMESDGTSVDGMPPVKTKQIVDAKGNVIKTTSDTGGGEHPVPNSVTITSSFPDHAVKIGETWTKTQKVPEGTIVSVYKLVKVDGDVATIQVTRDSKTPKVSSVGTIQIELSTGTPRSMNLDVVASNVPGPKGPHTVKIHTDLQKQ